jgi:protocatechuate 3,4-dioxygenase beta subunit
MRRRVAIGIGGAALGLAVVLLIVGRRGEGGGSDPAGAGGGAAAEARRRARIDPATVARGSIEGTVRDPAGAPVEGARVCGLAWSDALPAEAVRGPACVQADAAGRYRLAELLPARYAVDAQARGFAPGRFVEGGALGRWRDRGLQLAAGEARTGVDITLAAGGVEVMGIARDIGGGPIEGAVVSARGSSGSVDGASATVETGADGRFAMWTAPGSLLVRAAADGYADAETSAVAPGQLIELLLTPESVLGGRVVDATGAPVPGARVAVAGDHGAFDDDDDDDVRSAATYADGEGRFVLTRLTPGRYQPAATAPGWYGRAAESVLLGLGQTIDDVVIRAHPAAVLTGRIVVGDGVTPCAHGSVSLRDRRSGHSDHASAEADGRVVFEALLPGTYEVWVDCLGQAVVQTYPDVEVVAGFDPPEQVWTVGGGGGRLRGIVRGHDGRPAAHASVWATPSTGMVIPGGAAATGADGRFTIDGLAAGTYRVWVSGGRSPFEGSSTTVEVADGGEATIELRLREGGGVQGVVVDERGRPVARVRVHAVPAPSFAFFEFFDSTPTRDDGTFALDGLAPGAYQVFAAGPDGPPGSARGGEGGDDGPGSVRIEVRAGELAPVKLVLERPVGVIRGRVVDAAGAPVTDAFVDAERAPDGSAARPEAAARGTRWGWSRAPVLTDTAGAFAIEDLARGTYTVRAYRRGGGEAWLEHVAPGQAVTLTLRPTGAIAGTVSRHGGGAPDRMAVTARHLTSGLERSEDLFRTGGAFILRDLPPGRFRVTARSPDGTGATDVEVGEGQVVTGVTIALGGRARVTGRLIAADDGTPLAGTLVSLVSLDRQDDDEVSFDDFVTPTTTSVDGRFAIVSAPVGRVLIIAMVMDWQDGSRHARKVVMLEAGKTHDVGDLRVRRTHTPPAERGDLGFTLERSALDGDSGAPLTVATVRTDGPAARAGLRVGDVIVAIDGEDVRGDPFAVGELGAARPGVTIALGLARGATVAITAGPPR